MSLRLKAILTAALAVFAAGCHSVKQQEPKQRLVIATYASPVIPTPNDLALQAVPTLPPSAQRDLLQSFVDAGGFPYDQAPTFTIPIQALKYDPAQVRYVPDTPPTVDVTTITASTFVLLKLGAPGPTVVQVEPAGAQSPGVITLVKTADPTTGSRRLPSGRYVFALRGGPNGVKTIDGQPISGDSAIALTLPNVDLANPANQPPGGLPAALVTQLEGVRLALWNPINWQAVNQGGTNYWTPYVDPDIQPAYTAIDAAFPHAEVASLAAFAIAPSPGPVVLVDAGSGQAPLPIDLLRTGPVDPTTGEKTIAFNAAFGPIAEGLTTLSGFSTTAMMLAQTSVPVDASTVNGVNVFVYKLGATPTMLGELKALADTGGNPFTAQYVAEPDPIVVAQGDPIVPGLLCPVAGGCSLVIGLQPGVGAPLAALAPPGTEPQQIPTAYLPPLEESTSYAVIATDRVKDITGAPLAKSTVTKILVDFPHPVASNGVSLVQGIDDTTATALQAMKDELAPVLAALPPGTTTANVAAAYTFKTQSITPTALQIAAIPYQSPGAAVVAGFTPFDTATVAADYGIGAAFLPPAPAGPIQEFLEVQLNTLSLLLGSQNQGAFDPAHPTPEIVTALVAVPNPLLVPPCPGGVPTAHCAPLVVFRHGITRAKGDVLPIAQALTAAGFVVASIDAEKHGDRSYCTSDAQCCSAQVAALTGCTPSTCAFKANFTTAVDVVPGTTTPLPIGVCESAPGVRGNYLNKRIDCATPFLPDGVTPNPACLSKKGVPYVSGNVLLTENFFRLRDSFRQDVIDESAVIAALAPPAPPASYAALAAHLAGYAAGGIAIDPTKVYWVSQSLGSINGALSVAVNPRISRAVFNVPGATFTDIAANPDSHFHQTLLDLIAPIAEGSPAYLQLLQVAKWVLDPGDPANFVRHVIPGDLTGPLPFPMPTNRPVLTQIALCDNTIPNAQNQYFSGMLGLTVPLAGDPGTGRVQWYVNSATTASCPTDAVTHGFLLDGAIPTLTEQGQVNAATFLAAPGDLASTVRP
ncbi:MAG TPA: hypothetical protein VML50_02095 [Anaeromyxobacter sp.]|nr:hypothetical protein [Anaeromyxobacter sp.]